MDLQQFYQSYKTEGLEITGRVRKATRLFRELGVSGGRFLDIGCGGGAVALHIASQIGAESVHGVELGEAAIAEARARGIDVHAVDLNSGRLPFDDGSMKAVFCGEVLEHLVDTDHLLAEIRRVLAHDGICVLTTPNLAAWHNRIALLLGYQPFLTQVSFRHAPGRLPGLSGEGGGHLRVFTYRALMEFLPLCGLTVVASRGVGVFELDEPKGPSWSKRVLAPIDAVFTRIPSLACDVMVAVRRAAPHGR